MAASAPEPPALKSSGNPDRWNQEQRPGEVPEESSLWRKVFLTPGGKSERAGRAAGSGAAPGAPQRRTRPQSPRPGLRLRLRAPGGAASRAVHGVRGPRPHDDPARGLCRSGPRQAARSVGPGSPTGRRSPAAGKGFVAPRVSPGRSQPCGSRSRRSCCNHSRDWPIVLARSRVLSLGSARPGRS